MHFRLIRVAVVLLTLGAALHAQETIEVRLLELDVVVTDKQGNPVRGLGPNDLELFEDGKRQPITNLSQAPERPRQLVLVVDQLQLRGAQRTALFGDLRTLVSRVVRPGDRVQIFGWSRSGFAPQSLAKLEPGRAASADDGRSVEDDVQFLKEIADFEAEADGKPSTYDVAAMERSVRNRDADEELAEMHRRTASLQRIVTSLANAAEKTIVVYVAETFPATAPLIDTVVRAANAQGVAIYAFRPNPEGDVDALARLTEPTGGNVATGSGGIREAIERIASDVGSYYSLAYRARSDGSESERRLRVRAKNASHVVRSRATMVVRSERTRAEDLLVARLFERGVAGDIDFDIAANGPSVNRGNWMLVPVTLTIPVDQLQFVEEGNELAARFSVLVVSGTSIAERTQIKHHEHRIAAPAGEPPSEGSATYKFDVATDLQQRTVAVAVRDLNSDLMGVRTFALDRGWATVAPPPADPNADAAWTEARQRARAEGKRLLAFVRPKRCRPCETFERESVPHPMIARRIGSVVFTSVVATGKSEPRLELYDQHGTRLAWWNGVPDTTQFGAILDLVNGEPQRELRLAHPKAATAVAALQRFDAPIVSGRQSVRTNVTSAAVARVVFSVDGKDAVTVTAPPFSATLDFGRIPEAHTIGAVAYDSAGAELARDEITINDGGEVFWIRLAEPSDGPASGATPVSVRLRAPAARRVKQVTLSLNGKPAAALTAAPWHAVLDIAGGQTILQAVAELDDGTTAEDAVLLNVAGHVDRANVQLTELPVTVTPATQLAAKDFVVREGRRQRTVESVVAGADAPLTVGVILDVSRSMQKTLPDVQEAAIRFLDSILGPKDRAFLIAFDSRARLLLPPTGDRDALRQSILRLQPAGRTALYDAMILGLMQLDGVTGRRAIVVFTDGHDEGSRYESTDLVAMVRRSNTPIHLIRSTRKAALRPPPNEVINGGGDPHVTSLQGLSEMSTSRHTSELLRVTRTSGGRLHELHRLDQLARIYAGIAESLRAQTLVTIRTDPAASDNEWREIDVAVTRPGYTVRAPSGYSARR